MILRHFPHGSGRIGDIKFAKLNLPNLTNRAILPFRNYDYT